MKNTSICLACLIWLLTGCASIYYAPELPQREKLHKTIAIIPFTASTKNNQLPENTSPEQAANAKKVMGYYFRGMMYERFARKQKRFSVKFQMPAATDSLITLNAIPYDSLSTYPKDHLASLLGVDAIISGKVQSARLMPMGAAVGIGLATTALLGTFVSVKTLEFDVYFAVHDAQDNKLLWSYKHIISGGTFDTQHSVTKNMMRQISRNFPYRKKG